MARTAKKFLNITASGGAHFRSPARYVGGFSRAALK
jgi:hypothetical protein